MPLPGFAVLDVETTGLSASGSGGLSDRVVELAVVHVDSDGTITDAWDTLVEPFRDLGRTESHGLGADDLMGAPSFADVAPRLLELLDGRVLVAHNASFHVSFLIAELARIGYRSELPTGLCTMQLAREFAAGAGRTLQDCCAAYDIELPAEHRALSDATATARLLGAYLTDAPDSAVWASASVNQLPPIDGADAEWLPRTPRPARAASFLQRITVKLPEFSGPAEQLDYLALLDRCLLDRDISRHEADELVELAERLGISRTTCQELHHQYFEELTAIAWADGVLTEDEVQDLGSVGTLLSIPSEMVERAMEPFDLEPAGVVAPAAGSFALEPGDTVAFSGELERPAAEWGTELEEHGLVFSNAVSTATRLLVAAHPNAADGKVGKARSYGIPIVTEAGLRRLLDI